MVVTLLVPARVLCGLKDVITLGHLENMAKVMLATGILVGYAYGIEAYIAWYSANVFEQYAALNRAFGPYGWAYWLTVVCNVVVPQSLWFRSVRRSPWALFVISILINVGMWFERFVIIVTSLHRDFLPSSWGMFYPTWVDLLQLLGSFGLFLTLFLLFIRFLPMVAISEIKGVHPAADPHASEHAKGETSYRDLRAAWMKEADV
jgi:molybdopterin-containing oxidoreductase family membrane subunit